MSRVNIIKNIAQYHLPDAKPDAIWLRMLWKLAFLAASSIAETSQNRFHGLEINNSAHTQS